MTLFCGGHLGFESSLFFVTTDETNGSEVLAELYVALFRECNNCYRVYMLVHKPV